MPDSFIVDSSVVAKWFNKGESNEEEALALRNAWIEGKVELYSPSLLIYEVCNSIWKNPNIDKDKATSLSKLAVRLSPALLEVREDESSESMNFARRNKKLTFYDSVYIVLSKYMKYSLVSADRDQLKASKGYAATSFHISQIKNFLGT
jgi:predicted nucleic acid-binding protein